MTWKERMYAGLGEFLRSMDIDAIEVTNFEDRTEYGGYCDTCAYETTVCDLTYRDSKGKVGTWTYYGSFAELVQSIS